VKTVTTRSTVSELDEADANLDPITGAPGAHPVGVGTGAAGGGLAGAAIGGVVGGPIGAGLGAVIGAVSGGFVGKSAAEAVNPTNEHEYWRYEFVKRPYYNPGSAYEEYSPAYQYGWESYSQYSPKGKTFNEVEAELGRDWDRRRGKSQLDWERAKDASRDAWERVEKIGYSDSCGCP